MRKAMGASLLALLGALGACAGGGGAKAALYGQVHEPSGPVPNAEVRIVRGGSDQLVTTAFTGEDGKFTLYEKLAEGTYVAEVRHPQYRPLTQTFAYPVPSIDLDLEPLVRVHGIVRLPDESVASGAVLVFQRGAAEAVKAIASEAGNYAAEGLVAGEYVIQVLTPDRQFFYKDKHQLDGAGKGQQLNFSLRRMKEAPEGLTLTDPELVPVIVGFETPRKN